MKRLVTIAVAVAVVVALFGAYHHVRAQENARPSSPFRGAVPPAVVLASHSLITTYIDQGSASVTLPAGFTAIDSPVTINCSNVAGCTIGAESWAELGGQTTANNRWAICTQVDGSIVGFCPYLGTLPTDSSYVTGSLNNAVGVSVGTHTVQALAYNSAGGAFLAQYNNTYHVYRP